MKKYFILVFIFMLTIYVNAQQLPEVSFYMHDYARTNPGSLGSKDMVCANIIGKNALVGFPGHPTNLFANFQIPFNLFGGMHGAGVSILSDNIGFYKDIDVKLGYAFRFKVGEGTLGIGINGGFRQNSIDGQWVGTPTIDPASDPNVPQSNVTNLLAANVGAGLFYRSEDTYFGASVLNIYSQELDYAKANTTGTSTSTAKVTLRPHYFVTAGYSVQLNNPAFELQPSVNFLYDGATVTFDINGTLSYNKKIWGGVSYRAGSAVIGMLGLMIMDGVKVGYAYSYQTSALSKYSDGSHEVLINYCFKLGVEKTPQRYKSIRYL